MALSQDIAQLENVGVKQMIGNLMIGNLIFRLWLKKEENTVKRISENFRISSYNTNFSNKICP
jgi:hypothetical protein